MSKATKNSQIDNESKCEWCNKVFIRESTLLAHSCIKKNRWINKHEKWSLLGHYAWKQFFTLNSMGNKKEFPMKDFVQSKFYNDFVKLGWFLHNRKTINNEAYIDYVIRTNLKPADWIKESIYKEWVADYTKNENPQTAVERTIKHMDEWATKNNKPFNTYFSNVSTTAAVQYILDGFLSPWMIYLAESSSELLERMNDEQLLLIEPVINPIVWNMRLNRKRDEVENIKQLLKEFDL